MLRYHKALFLLLAFIGYEVVVANASIRIMPLGDILTVGSQAVNGSYRTSLYDSLTDLGYNIDFVGSKSYPPSNVFQDSDHEGHEDWLISDFTLYVEEFVQSSDPDVVVLMVGSLDILDGVDEAVDRIEELLDKIFSLVPSIEVFAANLPMRTDDVQNNLVNDFNSALMSLIQTYTDSGSNVNFVDVNAVVSLNEMESQIHPNQGGYDNMGKEFARVVASKITPDGTGLPPRAILRATGSADRSKVIVTFSRPFPVEEATVSNFAINEGIEISSVELDEDRRTAILQTSEQSHERKYQVVVHSASSGGNTAEFTVGWRSILLSDWHLGEKYVFSTRSDEIQNDVNITSFLKESFGGDLILIPGDTNAGFWSTEAFRERMSEDIGYSVTNEFAVLEAGRRCYGGVLDTFRKGGYWKVLVAFGDHEAGDNPWKANGKKSQLVPQFRQTFGEQFNYGIDGQFSFNTSIGDVPPRPFGTDYEGTSFAHIHKNTLIVTLDLLHQQSPKEVIGETGTVTGTIVGEHMEWFERILEEGRLHSEVKHILVQGHFPALFPVRKVKSSGIYVDQHDESQFVDVMRKHDVDIYFAGECHLNTVTKDEESNLIQVTSRGNYFSNVLTMDISDDQIHLTIYNEMGEDYTMHNYNYEQSGTLSIEKRSTGKSLQSSGELSFIDRSLPMLYFNFEDVFSLRDRPILGLGDLHGVRRAPIVSEVNVTGVVCTSSLQNTGAFGQNYDAQAANIQLIPGVNGYAASFNLDSRAAVLGMGPHAGGKAISYSLWMRTTTAGRRILLSYEGYWSKKNVWNLRLRNGQPELCYSESQLLRSNKKRLNDGSWHHLSVVIPDDNSMLSEVIIYVDGNAVQTKLVGEDQMINIPNGGMIAIGGFGYGNLGSGGRSRSGFKGGSHFIGDMDEVMVWARPLIAEEVEKFARFPGSPTQNPSPKESPYPTRSPVKVPTVTSSIYPSKLPSQSPSKRPTVTPSIYPSKFPSQSPSKRPTVTPTVSKAPSQPPSFLPSLSPSDQPSKSHEPTSKPSQSPSDEPTARPITSQVPSSRPTMCEEQRDRWGRYPLTIDGPAKTCQQVERNPRFCKYPNIQLNCPVACNLNCDEIDTESESELCEDNPDSFFNDKGKEKSCSALALNPDLCAKLIYQDNCKKTCFGSCDSTCMDTRGVTISGKFRPCTRATTPGHNLCKKDIFRRACPKSCALCS